MDTDGYSALCLGFVALYYVKPVCPSITEVIPHPPISQVIIIFSFARLSLHHQKLSSNDYSPRFMHLNRNQVVIETQDENGSMQ